MGIAKMRPDEILRIKEGCWKMTLFEDGSIYILSEFKRRHNWGYRLRDGERLSDFVIPGWIPNYARAMVHNLRTYYETIREISLRHYHAALIEEYKHGDWTIGLYSDATVRMKSPSFECEAIRGPEGYDGHSFDRYTGDRLPEEVYELMIKLFDEHSEVR